MTFPHQDENEYNAGLNHFFINEDHSLKKKAEELIRNQCGVSLADHEGCVLYVNRTFCNLFGYTENELVGQYPPYSFWPDYETDLRMKSSPGGKDVPPLDKGHIKQYIKKNGKTFWGMFTLTPVAISGCKGKGVMACILDITSWKNAEDELALSEKKLRALSRKLIKAREEERVCISKDLHDSIGSSLVAIRFLLEKKLKECGNTFCEGEVSLENIIHMVQDLVVEIRRISQSLYPQMLEQIGLQAALTSLFNQFQTEHPDVTLQYHLDTDQSRLSDQMIPTLYRLVQEALCNMAEHSRADYVELVLKADDESIHFKLEDNGIGFDIEQVMENGFTEETGLLGIQIMKERIEWSGGNLTIQSKKDQGTRIHAEWVFSSYK